MKSIAVFCASSSGHDPAFGAMAFEVGRYLAEQGCRVVYGGSRSGLMGQVADGALGAGGKVIGVLPAFMASRELEHVGLTELIMVDSMQERKLRMHELSDGVIALPGGFGTLEELFEMITWAQLGLHQKPIGVLNFMDYYHHLLMLVAHMTSCGLLKAHNASMLLSDTDLIPLLEKMRAWEAPPPFFKMQERQA